MSLFIVYYKMTVNLTLESLIFNPYIGYGILYNSNLFVIRKSNQCRHILYYVRGTFTPLEILGRRTNFDNVVNPFIFLYSFLSFFSSIFDAALLLVSLVFHIHLVSLENCTAISLYRLCDNYCGLF